MRAPQSLQSVPNGHKDSLLPGPPSSQSPSLACWHESLPLLEDEEYEEYEDEELLPPLQSVVSVPASQKVGTSQYPSLAYWHESLPLLEYEEYEEYEEDDEYDEYDEEYEEE
mgnify:CR=1 FL=1